MFLPIYAGFNSGISLTFGYVIVFVAASPVFYFLNKIPKIPAIPRMAIACVTGTLVVYTIGTLWMMFYMSWDLGKTLLVFVVPYLPFDGIKIVLAISVVMALPKTITNLEQPSNRPNLGFGLFSFFSDYLGGPSSFRLTENMQPSCKKTIERHSFFGVIISAKTEKLLKRDSMFYIEKG